MIDVNDSPLDCVWVNPLWIDCFEANDVYKWVTQFFGRNSIRQSGCHWREDVTTVETVADRMPEKPIVGQMNRAPIFFSSANPTESPVVRPDEKLLRALNQNWLSI